MESRETESPAAKLLLTKLYAVILTSSYAFMAYSNPHWESQLVQILVAAAFLAVLLLAVPYSALGKWGAKGAVIATIIIVALQSASMLQR